MTSIQQSSGQGALFELVARGKKDTYFLDDTSGSVFPYYSVYESAMPYITERRTAVPTSDTPFGSTFEIKLDTYGDLITECNLLIQLPTWLPDNMQLFTGQQSSASRVNNYYWITDCSGNSYGYVNYPAYFLFSKIQFYQDQILIQEWSGDSLFATGVTEGSWNSCFMDQIAAGFVADNTGALGRGIALRATPDQLRLKLPIPGIQTPGDGGFPICGCSAEQNYRFRIQLRSLEDLVVSSNNQIKPTPWLVQQFQYTMDDLSGANIVVPKSRELIGRPTILLETVQAYIPDTARTKIRNMHIKIPFRRQFENIMSIGPLDYRPFINNGDSVTIYRRIEGRHPAERILFFFRSEKSLDTNYLTDFTDPSGGNTMGGGGQFYKEIGFVIAGKDREYNWEPFVYQELNAFAKDERDSGFNIGEMRWNLGDVWERERPSARQPEGSVNFSSADRPTLYIELENIPSNYIQNTELRVIVEGWAVYECKNGRGGLMFAN